MKRDFIGVVGGYLRAEVGFYSESSSDHMTLLISRGNQQNHMIYMKLFGYIYL
jgi:hypothetical protein